MIGGAWQLKGERNREHGKKNRKMSVNISSSGGKKKKTWGGVSGKGKLSEKKGAKKGEQRLE